MWPLLLGGLTLWVAVRHARTLLVILCGAGAIASQLACGMLFEPDDTARAYYGTDTRAQALLIGAALAAMLTRPTGAPVARHRGRTRRLVLNALGLAGAGGTLVLWHGGADQSWWMYHGGLTAAAVGTALMITQVMISPGSALARLLGLAPLVWLGRISYGVYLWHWPLFTYVTADATGLSRWPLLAVRLAGTLSVAVLSYHLIERPIRHGGLGRLLPRRMPAAVTAAALSLVAVTIAFVTTAPPAADTAAAPVVITTTTAEPDARVTRSAIASKPAPIDRPGRPTNAGREPRVTFFGDSVSWVIGTYLPAHPGMWTSDRAIQGCGIATLPQILQLGTPHTNYPGCTSWQKRWQKGVDKDQPDVAVIELNRWELMDRQFQGRYQHVGDPAYDQYLTGRLERAINVVGSRGAAVVLLTAAYTRRAEKPDGGLYPEDQPARVDAWNRLLRATAGRHRNTVTVFDLNPVVCPDGKFTWKVGGLRVRSDGLHYTPAGVQRVIAPWLLPKLAAVANGTYPRGVSG
jgi:hypothetical protein